MEQIDVKGAVALLSSAMGAEYTEDDTQYNFILKRLESQNCSLAKQDIETIVNSYNAKNSNGETVLYDGKSFEICVRNYSAYAFPLQRNNINIDDIENELKYEVKSPQPEYILFILKQLSDKSLLEHAFPLHLFFNKNREELSGKSFFELATAVAFRFTTIRITSTKDIPLEKYKNYLMSFIFTVSYNLGMVLIPQNSISDFVSGRYIRRTKRSKIEEMDPPRRMFDSDLINHYEMALASGSSYLAFLSYYHVLEHFFEKVFFEDLINIVRKDVTHPGFSYKRDNDIRKLIKKITKSYYQNIDKVSFSEQDALILTLKKYITITDLVSAITTIDNFDSEYYKNTKVIFSDVDTTVDLMCGDNNTIYKQLAKRIYTTRNALVHSKAGEKQKYTPFQDDEILAKEIPLLRSISEMIIINSSQPM